MGSPHRVQHYQDVPVDDDDGLEGFDDEFQEEQDEGPQVVYGRRRNHRLRAPPATRNTCMQTYFLYLVLGLILACVALVGWKLDQRPPITTTPSPSRDDDDDDVIADIADVAPTEGMTQSSPRDNVIYYDPSVIQHAMNPFDLHEGESSLLQPPVVSDETATTDGLGFLMQPNMFNDTLVFVSEGDLYLTRVSTKKKSLPAMKLTTTVGNVRTPVLNPVYPSYVAYTATYTGRREVYLLDLRGGSQSTRLTYWDSPYGISQVVGWKDDGLTLVFAAHSIEVGLPDVRLYQMSLKQDDASGGRRLAHGPLRVWQLQPIPLTQAIDGVYDDNNKCLYFTRFSQSSQTIRYVGGTAESLWAWCNNHKTAVALTGDYNGTSKAPQIVTQDKKRYLVFMSDRLSSGKDAGSMNLWATPLPTEKQLYSGSNSTATAAAADTYIQLTHVSCRHDGKSLVEYAVDGATGNIVLRIGADLHIVKSSVVKEKLVGGNDKIAETDRLPIVVHSDFHEHQERLLPVTLPNDVTTVDVFESVFGTTSALLGLRGQLFVAPVYDDVEKVHLYAGAGMNLPLRRYRVAPGTAAGGSVRILASRYVPLLVETTARRLALVLATDPKSDTAEHGFYLLEVQSDSAQSFLDVNDDDMPDPFLGGHVNGGSVADGGLGSVNVDSVSVSPCGRRLAWTDTDGRICVMTLPMYQNETSSYEILPPENEQGQPLLGTEADLTWSPGGRYLAISHSARNQFSVISIADCGDPAEGAMINVTRIVQATPDRFNSAQPYWGKTGLDFKLTQQAELLTKLLSQPIEWPGGATVLYFLSDRDIVTDVQSPWGTRGPSPHFPKQYSIYALPLVSDEEERGPLTYSQGTFGGGGASELWAENIVALEQFLEAATSPPPSPKNETRTRHLDEQEAAVKTETLVTDTTVKAMDAQDSGNGTVTVKPKTFPEDREIDFGPVSKEYSFARRAYRLGNIPPGNYRAISQAVDDPSFAVIEIVDEQIVIKLFSVTNFPSNAVEPIVVELLDRKLQAFSFTTTREHIVLFFGPGELVKIIPNSAAGLASLISDPKLSKNIADTGELALSVWPALEYQQLYDDAWRLLRDYFYDTGMNGVDWPVMHARYRELVKRCAKREELDDVLRQMASELSALHVFVYGGEYRDPLHGSQLLGFVHQSGSLGASLMRSAEWKGYVITSIPERDPDYNLQDGKPKYSPLSNRALQLTGQRGLEVGDVIVAVNGESVMRVPDIHMLLRGMRGRSVRLDVLRLASGDKATEETRRLKNATKSLKKAASLSKNATKSASLSKNATKSQEKVASSLKNETMKEIALVPEPVITVPISPEDSADLRYGAWEWQTRELAKQLAQDANFTVGYVHLRSMGPEDADAFYRGFYPDYNKQALIIDVRHNRGGNIDSWLLDILQRRAWMYWQGRVTNIHNGGLGWDEQFAFRGHLVVLIDAHTSSDGEGFSRGVSELGLGKLIGKRTWGGGIWLSSDNHLVDGGIATAPEVGTYNNHFGWGLGIEQMGVEPDFDVDNNPRTFYDGKDEQLEFAITYLAKWLKEEPIVEPKNPGPKKDMSLPKAAVEDCPAT